jgi:hydrogenase maturation protease
VTDPASFWDEMARPGPSSVLVSGVQLRRGSRVRLWPNPGGDIFDLVLAGKAATVEGLDADEDGQIHVAVTVDDDPGRDLGEARQPGHRFFFSLGEVEPLGDVDEPRATMRILVAGIGNMFLGDDGFGVEVARRLAERELPPGVEVGDFGIRGMDLAFTLQDGYDAAIFVDTAPLGEPPGTLTVIEADVDEGETVLDTHGMDPVRVLRLARELGRAPARTLIVACQPQTILTGEHDEDLVAELSPPVLAAVEEAAGLVEELVRQLIDEGKGGDPDG